MKKIIAVALTFLAFTVSAETFAKCNCGCKSDTCAHHTGHCKHNHCPKDKK